MRYKKKCKERKQGEKIREKREEKSTESERDKEM